MATANRIRVQKTNDRKPSLTNQGVGVRGRRRHTREQRAKCRLLHAAGVSIVDLISEFGGSVATMDRTIRNNYARNDDETKDMDVTLPDTGFGARLEKLKRVQIENGEGGRKEEVKRTISRRDQSPVPDIVVLNGQAEVEEDELEDELFQEDFLLTFLTQVSLEHLYSPLNKIGVDEAGLRRMARFDEQRLEAFMAKVAKHVPEMTLFMRLTLCEELKRLA